MTASTNPTPTKHGINVPLLRKEVEWTASEDAKAKRGERSEWNQDLWCGTACCIAGRIVLDEGWTHLDGMECIKDGVVSWVPHAAAEALGLELSSAIRLFAYGNTIDDLWRIAGELTNGEIVRPVTS